TGWGTARIGVTGWGTPRGGVTARSAVRMRVSALRTGRRRIPGRGTTRMRAAGRATARTGPGGRRAVPRAPGGAAGLCGGGDTALVARTFLEGGGPPSWVLVGVRNNDRHVRPLECVTSRRAREEPAALHVLQDSLVTRGPGPGLPGAVPSARASAPK